MKLTNSAALENGLFASITPSPLFDWQAFKLGTLLEHSASFIVGM